MNYGKDFYEYLIGNEKTEGYEIQYLSGPAIIAFGKNFGDFPYEYRWGGLNLSRWDYMKRLIDFVENKIGLSSFYHVFFIKNIAKNNSDNESQKKFIRDINNRLLPYGQKLVISNKKIEIKKVESKTILNDINIDLEDETNISSEIIGEGGFANITTTSNPKILKKNLRNLELKTAKDKARFEEEFRILEFLENPKYFIQVFDFDLEEYSYTLARADGSLTELIHDLGDEEIIKSFYQICEAVKHMHTKNIYHRDIKGDNCLKVGERWVLSDFGISKGSSSLNLTTTGNALGTYGYIHPDILANFELWKKGYIPKYDYFQIGRMILNNIQNIKNEAIRDELTTVANRLITDSNTIDQIIVYLRGIFTRA